MTKDKLILTSVILFGLMILLAVFAWGPLGRVYVNHKLLSDSKPEHAMHFSMEAWELSGFENELNLDVGYAKAAVPGEIEKIRHIHSNWVAVESKECSFAYLGLYNSEEETAMKAESFFALPGGAKSALRDLTDEYDWKWELHQTQPISAWQVACMSQAEFNLYFVHLAAKSAMTMYGTTRYFETDHVKGFAWWKNPEKDSLVIELFDKHSPMAQYIMIGKGEASTLELDINQITDAFLSSFQYKLDYFPEEEERKKIIVEAVSSHPKYEEKVEEKP